MSRWLTVVGVLFATGCTGSEEVVIHGAASMSGIPRGVEDLRVIETQDEIERSLAIAPGQGFVIDITSTDIGVPLLVDTGTVDRIVVYSPSPIASSLSDGGAVGAAYLVSRSASGTLGTYCLHLKGRVSIMGEPGGPDNTIDVALDFSEGYNPIGLVGVCPATNVTIEGSTLVPGRSSAPDGQTRHWMIR